ncbi:MAG: HD domain-containing protein [Candidatus Omnitrophica bacterium]|nr:HD domain-containing protein [Candidatus Omnitrophota bacterium]
MIRKYLNFSSRLRTAYKNLKKSYKEVKDSYAEMIFRMALVAELKDDTTGTHLVRIADYSTELAAGLGLAHKTIELIKYASPMHDIGKLVITDNILKKPGKLTSEERMIMEKHTIFGADIFEGSKAELLIMAQDICITHHEKYDGSGYPYKKKGEEISLAGRIVAVADVFDALTNARPYKNSIDFDVAVDMLSEESGKHFDPKVIAAFMKNIPKIRKIWQATKDIDSFVNT